MTVRVSGMVSGMDTDSLVEALVSSYKVKKDNLVKAQTKLSWKSEQWKTMNTSIYSFYSGKLSAARLSTNYNLKSASVSDSSVAKVTASSSAVNGTQTLAVNKLAATGYLTGGEITDSSGSSLTASSTVAEVSGLESFSSGNISVTVNDETTDINITSDMTLTQVVNALKNAGLNASFDETNGRFFVSSKESGADNDFTLTASDSSGLTLLQNLGIYSTSTATTAEYTTWANYTDEELEELAAEAATENTTSVEDRATAYAKQYNTAYNAAEAITDEYGTLSEMEALQTEYEEAMAAYDSYKTTDEDGNETYDTDAIEEAGLTDEFNTAKTNLENITTAITNYTTYQTTMSEVADYVVISDDGTATAATEGTTAYDNIQEEYDSEYQTNYESYLATYTSKREYAQSVVDGTVSTTATGASANAVRIAGSDSEIVLNGATFTSDSNTFSINGLTIQATALTGDEEVTITTDTDVDGIYDFVKDFITDYNTLIKEMDVKYNAASSKGYEPLTSEEKEAMSDDEVEKWETKIKDSLLRKDGILGLTMNSLKADMASAITIDGNGYSLASFGISTLGYFSSPENETGVYHIDGNSEDSATSGNEDKLREAIANDSETVISFFSQLATKLYTDLGNRMASSSTSSAYTIYNDKEMNTQYSQYTSKITDAEDKITTWEDYYYKKFSAMESSLASLNSQQSSLSSYFG
ncbi:flagellar filament capping protein FliD [Lachnospira pectinoschiza]|uniref:Flagellar hook-associated protein 2 n=1 Tax=Lachnospira pectinoschiza TaxID=28052 RepID=A0A1G9XL68_9FIRM|nr:flagellar filament capping protein FliD [Lachnospira pectinoschiza]SDM97524.1 flagellar hook-associated protein 2 [Lachnospira pectinoschiza]